MMSPNNECWDTLTEIAEGSEDAKVSRSQVLELMAQFRRDISFDAKRARKLSELRRTLYLEPPGDG